MKVTKHFEERMNERNINWEQINETLNDVRKVKKGSNGSGKTLELVGPNVVVVIDPVNKNYVTVYKRWS